MTIEELKEMCQSKHKDKDKLFKEGCLKCEYWSATTGCVFYNRPIDWAIKEQKNG